MPNYLLPPEVSGLTPKQQHALRLLAQGETVSETASQTAVDRKTLYNWLEPHTRFSYCLDATLENRNRAWAEELNSATQRALKLLSDFMDNNTVPHHVRLKAALAILNREQRSAGWPKFVSGIALSARNRSPLHEFEDCAPAPEENLVEPQAPRPIPQNSTLSQFLDEPEANFRCPRHGHELQNEATIALILNEPEPQANPTRKLYPGCSENANAPF